MIKEWYEIYIETKNRNIVLDTVDSLEEAENVKERLNKKGIQAKIFKWNLTKAIPKNMGEV